LIFDISGSEGGTCPTSIFPGVKVVTTLPSDLSGCEGGTSPISIFPRVRVVITLRSTVIYLVVKVVQALHLQYISPSKGGNNPSI
jgi:hypothetical protein